MIRNSFIILMLSLFIFGSATASDPLYTCGNANASVDGYVDLADIVCLINNVYLDGDPLLIPELGNVDGSINGDLDLADITRLICLVYLHTCDGNCPPVTNPVQSGCLEDSSMPDGEPMYVEVINNNLHIFHPNAFYQCCLFYSVNFEFDGNEITATESDLGDLCDCYCIFDLESIIYFLEPGEYIVTLIGISGDTVGIDTAIIPADFELIGWENSDCLPDQASPLSLADVIFSYDGDTLTVVHGDASFNCALDLNVEVAIAGDTIRIFERNLMSASDRVKCICDYKISTQMTGVSAGTWILEIYQNDWPANGYPDELVNRQVILLE